MSRQPQMGDPYAVPELGRDGLLAGGKPAVANPGTSEAIGRRADGAIIRRADLIRLQGVDELALLTTVALVISPEGNIDPGKENESPACVAKLTFGIGGTTADAEVDFVNGTLITVPASRLDLRAELDVPDVQVTRMIRVGAFVSYLPVTRGARRTRRITALAAAASVIVEVPKFARDLTLLSVPASPFTVDQAIDSAAAIIVASTPVPLPSPYTVIPIASDARYVRITNTGGVPADVRAVFGLSL